MRLLVSSWLYTTPGRGSGMGSFRGLKPGSDLYVPVGEGAISRQAGKGDDEAVPVVKSRGPGASPFIVRLRFRQQRRGPRVGDTLV